MKYYSIGILEDGKMKLIKSNPTVIDGDYGPEVVYYVSDGFDYGQAFLYHKVETPQKILEDPCMLLEDSHMDSPSFEEVDEPIEDFFIVDVTFSKEPIPNSQEVYLYEVNENHPKYSPNTNRLISYTDELPPDDAEYQDDAYRELFLEEGGEEPITFSLIIEGNGFTVVYSNKEDFPSGTFDKVKYYMKIERM